MRLRAFRAAAIGTVLVSGAVGACGDDARTRAEVATDLPRTILNGDVVVGQDSFLGIGLPDSGGVDAVVLTVDDEGLQASPTAHLGGSVELTRPRALELVDRGWLVGAWGCGDDRPDCPAGDATFFEVAPDANVREVGTYPEIMHATFKLIGQIDDGLVLIEAGVNEPGDGQIVNYAATYWTLDVDTGRLSRFGWDPPSFRYDSVLGDTDGGLVPERSSCVKDGAVYVLDRMPDGGQLAISLTSVQVKDLSAESENLVGRLDGTPAGLLCGPLERSPAVVTVDDTRKRVSVSSIAALDAPKSTVFDQQLSGISIGTSSVLLSLSDPITPDDVAADVEAGVSVGQGPTSEQRLAFFADDEWLDLQPRLRHAQQAFVSEDGSSLLVRAGSSYEGQRL